MIYFIADTHFGHENVIWMCERPYANIDEMNEAPAVIARGSIFSTNRNFSFKRILRYTSFELLPE